MLSPGVDERRMRRPRAVLAVVALEQDPLVVLHPAQVVPFAFRRVLDASSLAGAVRIAMLHASKLVIWDSAGIGVGKW